MHSSLLMRRLACTLSRYDVNLFDTRKNLVKSLITSEIQSRLAKGETKSHAINAIHKEMGPLLGLFEKNVLAHLNAQE